jgi:DNA-binding MarR family transcriptional regulator
VKLGSRDSTRDYSRAASEDVPEWAAFDDEAMRRGHTVVPNLVFELVEVPAATRFMYILLLRYAWQEDAAYPTQRALMRDLGCSLNTVRTHLEELEGAGMIRREKAAGKVDVIRFLRLSDMARQPQMDTDEHGSEKPLSIIDTPSEIEAPQKLRGTPSIIEGVGTGTPSVSAGDNPYEEDSPPEEDSRERHTSGGSPPAGLAGRAKTARKAARGKRRKSRLLTAEQHAVRQAAVDRLHVRIREYTGLAEPPGYPDGAAAGFFAERVLAGDTEADCTDGIEAYLGRLEQQQTDAARHGRRITPHGSFAFLKSSWGSILQQITEERKRRNGIHRRAAKGAERPAAQTAGEVNGATRIPGGEAEPTRAAGAGPGAPAGAARAGARERRGADRVAAAALGEIGRRLAGGVPGGGGVGEEEADSADGGGGEAGSRTRAGPDAQGAGGAGDAEFG